MTSDTEKCKLFNANAGKNGSTNPFQIENSYGGIPQNLLTNTVLLAFLIGAFLVIRKSAFRVFNKVKVNKQDFEKWTHTFFAFTSHMFDRAEKPEDEVADPDNPKRPLSQHDLREDAIDGAIDEEEQGSAVSPQKRPPSITRSLSISESMTFWQWFKSIFTLGDDDIQDRCGNDALQYIRFVRHVIFYLCIVVVLSIGVILPLNFQGTLQGNETSFEHTTLVNLDPESDYLWVHVIFSFLFFPLAIVVMRKFSVEVEFQEVSLEISRTLMIERVPRYLCKADEVERHFSEAYPGIEIRDIRFAYNVEKLLSIHQDLQDTRSSRQFCERDRELRGEEGHPLELYDHQCSRCCSCICCCCFKKHNALEFYTDLEEKLTADYEKEKERALRTPLGIVFVTFRTMNMSKEVFDSFRRSIFQCNFQPPASTLSAILKPQNWKVSFAPTPDDIYWENLTTKRQFLLLKKIVINLALFFIMFFLTTPEYLVSQTDYLVQLFGKGLRLPSALVDFLPTILLWSFTSFMPVLVAWSDRFLGHWTRSAENHAIMKKTFWYLLFMVVMLPTFGFTTFQAGVNFFLVENRNETYRWECVFLPDSGAFFVNYIITAALAGAGLELIRFPELFLYCVQVCWSRSKADNAGIRRGVKYEFRFGEQYARMMLMFSMTMMYSLSCPLIVPFGLLYFVTKYYVDRHNLLYAYKPSKINKGVHSTAISFVILSTVILLFFMMVFTVLRSGSLSDLTLKSKVEIGLFLLAVNVFSAQLWSETCKKFSPIEYIECTYLRESEKHNRNYVYLPEVLKSDAERREERRQRSDLPASSPERHAPNPTPPTPPRNSPPPSTPGKTSLTGSGDGKAGYDAQDYGSEMSAMAKVKFIFKAKRKHKELIKKANSKTRLLFKQK